MTIKCPTCQHEFDSSAEKEVSPGVVACPKCDAAMNGQTGEAIRIDQHDAMEGNTGAALAPVQTVRARIAAATFDPAVAPPARFMWAPAGIHTICAEHESGKPCLLTVNVTAQGAARVRACFAQMLAANGKRKPYGDFNHDRTKASVWPEDFEWDDQDDEPGIYVRGEWSAAGLASVKGKEYLSWSPTLGTDAAFDQAIEKDGVMMFPAKVRGSRQNPAEIVAVGFDVGTLTNEPAFTKISQVRAKLAAPAETPPTVGKTETQPPPSAAKGVAVNKVRFVRARGTHTVGQVVDLAEAEANAAIAAGDAVATTAEVETIRAQNAALQATVLNGAITRAKSRQALAAKADDTDPRLVRAKKIASADLEAAVEYLDGLPVDAELTRASGRQTPSVEVVEAGLIEHVRGFVRAKEMIPGLMRNQNVAAAGEQSKIAGLIYGNKIRAMLLKDDIMVRDLVRAATTTDANVGYLAGDLVLQETLEFLQNFLPLFDQVTTSFKAEAIEYGQTVIAHYLGVPDVLTFSETTGWGTSKAANAASTPSATGVAVAINAYKGVEVRFTATQIGGTVRNLFREQVEPSAYALAQNVVQAWIALITAANFTGTALSVALADFKAEYFATMGKTLDDAGVARMLRARTVVLHTDYTNKLFEDADLRTTATLAAAYRGQQSSMLETGELPLINGIKPIGTQEMSLNGAAKRVGFLFGKSATAIASRLMADWTKVFPDVPASAAVTVATHPATGLSMMLTRYTDAQLETGNQRMSLAYGVAKGQAAAGRLIVKP